MMNSWQSQEELVYQVVTLESQGMSRRAISRALGVSRNTVRRILKEHTKARKTKGRPALSPTREHAPRPSKLDIFRPKVDELLSTYPDITAQRVLERLQEAGFDGGYTIVRELVKTLRPKPQPAVSLPTPTYEPGEMAESDWSPYRIVYTTGLAELLQCFGYALVYSRRKSFSFFERSDLHALMDGHVESFERFGGVAWRCKYDCQKAVVLRWEGRQPIYNLRFIDFATYYEFSPVACRPGHPNDKPIVERSFWELERSFFNGRSFRDRADLKEQLAWWMDNVCDPRPRKKLGKRSSLEVFAEETETLRKLPTHPYDTARVVYRLCDIEGFVAWEGNRYSVPFEHVTDILPVRITQDELFVYAPNLTCVARHELLPKGAGQDRELREHRPKRNCRGPDLDVLRNAFEGLGPSGAEFLGGLEAALPRSAAYHARRILALRERYSSSDLLAALDHAHAYGAYDHGALERILTVKAAPRRLDEYVAQSTATRIDRAIGESRTEPRDLSEYDRLPCWSTAKIKPGGNPWPNQGKQPASPRPARPEPDVPKEAEVQPAAQGTSRSPSTSSSDT
jgi:transposase